MEALLFVEHRPRAGAWCAGALAGPARPCVASASRSGCHLNRKIDADLISAAVASESVNADECRGCQGYARIHFYTKVAPGLRDDGNTMIATLRT